MRTLKYFLSDAVNNKAIVHKLDFIREFSNAKLKSTVFLKMDSRYAEYFPEYSNYFGRSLRLLISMYGMTNSVKSFADEVTECLLEAGFAKSQYQMSIYGNQ